jgi:hypothetical protein
MNRHIIASLLLLAAFAAQAEGPLEIYAPPGPSAVTRAEVMAELRRAVAAGEVIYGERSYVAQPTGRALTRAEVRADFRLAQAAGAVHVGEATWAPEFERLPKAAKHLARHHAAARMQ